MGMQNWKNYPDVEKNIVEKKHVYKRVDGEQ